MSRCASCGRQAAFGHWAICQTPAARHWRRRVLLHQGRCSHPYGLVRYASGRLLCIVCDLVMPVSLPASTYPDPREQELRHG